MLTSIWRCGSARAGKAAGSSACTSNFVRVFIESGSEQMDRANSSDILAAPRIRKRGKLCPLAAASLRDKRRELMANRVNEIRLAPTHVPIDATGVVTTVPRS
jgi:hypothetical protein